ncbi:hypothetical protein [Rubrivirga marina]|uniref:Uncharacterized protein n=1 Tax=Rubrivirga marina TaxID=1196024 RepID=A0A271IY15_9BACT|nr:hypothetical protein [Rubrivirga marina]PAP75684.1 hypothetical protein BSZ37_04155 [Rubrivirga marina]
MTSSPSRATLWLTGLLLLAVPTIQYGGYFLVTVVSGWSDLALTDFQRAFFRAGHAHAGVLVILALVGLVLADHAALPAGWRWTGRIALVLAPILVSGGFFASAIGEGVTEPPGGIALLWIGVAALALAMLTLGVGLLRAARRAPVGAT